MPDEEVERVGDWMQTYTGRAFYPLDPRPEDIDIRDIAHSLSLTCRYAGHVNRFYSVAEHCVLMSMAVHESVAFDALMHDAAEAYVGDMVRPLKQNLPEYKHAEELVMLAIRSKFGMQPFTPHDVKEADTRILLDERAALMNMPPMPWHKNVEGKRPLGVKPTGWDPRVAEMRFLGRFRSLTMA